VFALSARHDKCATDLRWINFAGFSQSNLHWCRETRDAGEDQQGEQPFD
jgi:hypothetical protein